MKPVTFAFIFALLFRVNHSIDTDRISKVICYFSRFQHAEIFKTDQLFIHLSKSLFQECNIKVKIVQEATGIGNDLIVFVQHGNDTKERL